MLSNCEVMENNSSFHLLCVSLIRYEVVYVALDNGDAVIN